MIAIIDYDAGNLTSVLRAVNHLGKSAVITNDLRKIESAERIIFPGVGAAGSAMESLRRRGLDTALKDAFAAGKPILAICIGCQIILTHSEENDTPCLDLIGGVVKRFPENIRSTDGAPLKIPHMGWNGIQVKQDHPFLSNIRQTDEFYFVHGYFPAPRSSDHVIAVTDHGLSFASVIACGRLFAVQFHLEKSGKPGLTLLDRFLSQPL